MHVLERAEPLPVHAGVVDPVSTPAPQVGADAERASFTGHDDDPDVVVPARVFAGACELAQHPEVESVQPRRPVERDRRAWRRLLVANPLEAELGRIHGQRGVGLAHETSANNTLGCGKPRLYASLPVAMNSSLRVPLLNASSSANSHSA